MLGVTTFSKDIWDAYGKSFLDQIELWPGKWVVYLEHGIDYSHPRIDFKSLYEIDGILNFLTNIKNLPKARGILDDGSYNYNYDIFKFCRKMFAQFDAFNYGGKVFWLDSDLKFKREIPEIFLNEIFDDAHLSFLGREGFYTETGFIGFDTDHPDFNHFKERYIDSIRKGQVFKLKRWQDCECFDWAREGKGNNLTPEWTPKDGLDVVDKSVLGDYMIHYKGNKKRDLMV